MGTKLGTLVGRRMDWSARTAVDSEDIPRMTKGQRKYKDGWAIMSVDPGGTTGVCEALVPRRPTVAACMSAAKLSPYEVGEHDPIDQSVHIALNYLNFVARAQLKYHIDRRHILLAIESFQLRQRNVELSPLEIHSQLKGLLYQHDPIYIEQTASQAKTFATDARLRVWGCYVRGSAHKRDAIRHTALAVATQLSHYP